MFDPINFISSWVNPFHQEKGRYLPNANKETHVANAQIHKKGRFEWETAEKTIAPNMGKNFPFTKFKVTSKLVTFSNWEPKDTKYEKQTIRTDAEGKQFRFRYTADAAGKMKKGTQLIEEKYDSTLTQWVKVEKSAQTDTTETTKPAKKKPMNRSRRRRRRPNLGN